MKVNWHDSVVLTVSAQDGTIIVRQQEIDVWIDRPDARFTLRGFRQWTGEPQYALGEYDLPG